MLSEKNAVINIATKDLKAAGKFYEETLGLKMIDQNGEEVTTFQSGNSAIYVYRSEFAGTNEATTMTWMCGSEMEDIVRSLKAKGVHFEHYDMPNLKRDGDIHGVGDMKAAWFKDPDGNILALVNG
jgi:catechol 2,3-dioxygenase-like lactoylglutathione lyase family enzyme